MGGLIDAIVNMGRGVADRRAAKKNAEEARHTRDLNLRLFQSQNHQPELVSRHIGPYERSQSPVADAFLQSLLTGQSPGAVQGTRAGAPAAQRAAQQGFDASTGGFDALRARQQAIGEAQPWATHGFNRDISGLSNYDLRPDNYGAQSIINERQDRRDSGGGRGWR